MFVFRLVGGPDAKIQRIYLATDGIFNQQFGLASPSWASNLNIKVPADLRSEYQM